MFLMKITKSYRLCHYGRGLCVLILGVVHKEGHTHGVEPNVGYKFLTKCYWGLSVNKPFLM